ncbi:MAG TPA: oligosaccharide flippase family protein, partial [Paracoccaceae bacterium]|nr:oligosaccharide flippase family protein [Paracoccaceae bacterium]
LNVPRFYYSVHLQRMLDWRRIRTLDLVSFGCAALSALGLAFAGFGVVALLAQLIAVPVPYIIDLVVRRPDLLRVRFRLSGYAATIRFGMIRNATYLGWVGQRLLEASVFTAVAGFAGFGVYGRALGLAGMTAGWLTEQGSTIAYPVLARLPARGGQLPRAAGLVLRLTLCTSAPLAVPVFLFNDTAVRLLYGPAWDEVAPLLRPVLVVAVTGAMTRGLGVVVLVSLGAGAGLALQLAMATVCALGLWLALPVGPLAYAWFLAAGNGAVLVALGAALIATGALRVGDVVAAVTPPLVLAAAATAASASGPVAAWDAAHSVPALAAAIAAALLLAAGAVRLLDPAGLQDALAFAPGGARLARVLGLGRPAMAGE